MSDVSGLRKMLRSLVLRLFGRRLAAGNDNGDQVRLQSLHRILVVRQHDRLCDLLFCIPALRALRQAASQAEITLITNSVHAPLFRGHELVDEVLSFGPSIGNWDVSSIWRFVRKLRSGFDLAIVLNTNSHSLLSDMLARLSRARRILGSEHLPFDGCETNSLYSLRAPHMPGAQHQADRNLEILRHISVSTSNLTMNVPLPNDEFNRACEFLLHRGIKYRDFVLGIDLDPEEGEDGWPIRELVAVAKHFSVKYLGHVVVFWGATGARRGRQLLEGLPFEPTICANFKPQQRGALFACCNAILASNLDTMCLAAAVNVPLVGLFGEKDPRFWTPIGRRFRPLRGSGRRCVDIPLGDVIRYLDHIAFTYPKSSGRSADGFDISEQVVDEYLGFGDIRDYL